jgi:DNA-binding CsgD family transcriptional regulator
VDSAFVGRETELAVLNAAREEVSAGQPRIVGIQGAPGIGKTSLLERFRTDLAGAVVFAATGEESEAALEFGILSQLLSDFQSTLPASIRPIAALRPEHGDPYMVGAGLVEALSDVEKRSPVVFMIDDAQWADRSSLQALGFAFRRLEADRIMLLLSVRETFDALPEGVRRLLEGHRGRRISLGGLGLSEVIELARREGRPLRAHIAQRLRANTDGNPLFLRASLDELEAGALEGSWASPLPAPRTYTRAIRARFDRCSPACRGLIEAAAVLGVRCRLDELVHVASTVQPLAALDEAVGVEMLTHHETQLGGEVRFVHPLIRAAVYHSLALQRRSELHVRAAVAMRAEPLAIHHAALASQAPNPALAARLERFAHEHMQAGSWMAAAQALTDAARLSADRRQRQTRQLDAADCCLWAGDTAAATRLLTDTATGGSHSARREYLRARLAEFAGRALDADAHYRRAWQHLDLGEEDLATRIAGWYSMQLTLLMRSAEAIRWGRRAVLAPGSSLLPLVSRMTTLCIALATSGDTAAVREFTAALPDRPSDAMPDQLELLVARGFAGCYTDQLVEARDDLEAAAAMARQRGDALSLVMALGMLADVEYRLGDWDAAVTHGLLSASTAEDCEHLAYGACCFAVAAFPHIGRGAWAEAETYVQAAERMAGITDALTIPGEYAAVARARLELSRRRPVLAEQALERLASEDAEPLQNPAIQPWQLLHAEAVYDQGRHEAAARILDEVEPRIHELGLRSLLVAVGRLRGQIEASAGRLDRAFAAFESGISGVRPETAPYEFARLEVSFGSVLRRRRQRRAARDRLESARRRLVTLRAEPELRRCEAELASTGLRPIKRTVDPRNSLTSQELAVARLVARGARNREVAAELFVSVRTVEFHLGNIYSKLDLTSRGQLMRYMLEPAGARDQR